MRNRFMLLTAIIGAIPAFAMASVPLAYAAGTIERPERGEGGERPEHPEKPEHPNKPEHPEKPEKPEHPEKPTEGGEHPERPTHEQPGPVYSPEAPNPTGG